MDGTKYEGYWDDNKKNGRGALYYPNGDKYRGDWKNDKKHGKGIFFTNF